MSALRQKRTFNDASNAGNFPGLRQINTFSGNLLSVERSMIDAVLNVAVFAALVLCIVGFVAGARKRVPGRHDQLASRQPAADRSPSSAPSCNRMGSRSPSIAKRNTARASSSGFTVLLPTDLSVSHASSKAVSKSTRVWGSKAPLPKPRIAPPSTLIWTICMISGASSQSWPAWWPLTDDLTPNDQMLLKAPLARERSCIVVATQVAPDFASLRRRERTSRSVHFNRRVSRLLRLF